LTIYELVWAKWLEAGILINEGVTQAGINHFEETHNLSLPRAFRDYLFTTNGMKDGQVDENLICFLSLEAIGQEANYRDISGSEVEMVVAEFLMYSHWYVLRASRRADRSFVLVTNGEQEKQIADSFEDFLSQYLANPVRVAHCWT
jgi:hypothetical protein